MQLPIGSLQRFETEAKKAIAELSELAETHDVTVFCENDGEAKRFGELLDQDAPGLSERIDIAIGYLHRGFVWTLRGRLAPNGVTLAPWLRARRPAVRRSRCSVITSCFTATSSAGACKKVIASRPVDSFLDLKVGDYVVHVAHGIAQFRACRRSARTARPKSISRCDSPTTRRCTCRRPDQPDPEIHRRVSRASAALAARAETWEKQKAKVSEAVMDMAAELIEIQAARSAEPGVAYPPDTEWQREFEAEFPYEPTADQITGAEDIKQDMRKPRPMDRLLCGDVGYGKTELAMRAAFKAVEFGKQVAVLVPTTVLAEQHDRTFRERMADYPFTIESISRFKIAQAAEGDRSSSWRPARSTCSSARTGCSART